MKSAKKIIRDSTNNDGSLNNEKAARAILQHRNTPIPELGISPAQILFHRQLRNTLPANPRHYQLHKEWVISASEREEAFAKTNQGAEYRFNRNAHTLTPLSAQTAVRVQSKGLWNKSGRIVEALPHRQYRVRLDGSGRITLRNRKFLKPVVTSSNASSNATQPSIIPSADYSTMPTLTPPPMPPPAHVVDAENTPPSPPTLSPAAPP